VPYARVDQGIFNIFSEPQTLWKFKDNGNASSRIIDCCIYKRTNGNLFDSGQGISKSGDVTGITGIIIPIDGGKVLSKTMYISMIVHFNIGNKVVKCLVFGFNLGYCQNPWSYCSECY
jgi:hypothetical protein